MSGYYPSSKTRRRSPYRRSYDYGQRRFDILDLMFAVTITLVVLIVSSLIGLNVWSSTQTDKMTCTVIDKDRAASKDGGSDMRIYTQDCGTLVVTDSIIERRWDSADFYAKIEKGKRYEFTTRGARVPIMSMFPNITSMKEVSQR